MDNFVEGEKYVITTKHSFVGVFSHYETIGGISHACFEEKGEGRYGKTYRKVSDYNYLSSRLPVDLLNE